MKKLLPLLSLLSTLLTSHAAEQTHVLVSPDGKLKLTLRHVVEDGLSFAFEAHGRELIGPSPIGHAAGEAPVTGTWAGIATRSVDEVWKPLWGKRAAVPDRFNEATVDLTDSQLDAHRVYQPKTFVTSVFVNMLAGPIDMCNGLADLTQAKRVDEPSPVPSTLAGEGARTLIVFSGSTVIPDIPENYRKHPEILEFISAQKMPWRESRTLGGVIGEHIVMARQAADGAWLDGAATNEDPRVLDVPLDFLPSGTFDALIALVEPKHAWLINILPTPFFPASGRPPALSTAFPQRQIPWRQPKP